MKCLLFTISRFRRQDTVHRCVGDSPTCAALVLFGFIKLKASLSEWTHSADLIWVILLISLQKLWWITKHVACYLRWVYTSLLVWNPPPVTRAPPADQWLHRSEVVTYRKLLAAATAASAGRLQSGRLLGVFFVFITAEEGDESVWNVRKMKVSGAGGRHSPGSPLKKRTTTRKETRKCWWR